MRPLVVLLLVVGLLFEAQSVAEQTVAERAAIDFNQHVRPILSDKCYFCHGPAEDSRQADLRLDLREAAIDYGAIEPGEPDLSLLVERIEAEDEDLRMPPPESNRSLTTEQVAILRRWVESGAEYAKHWSFTPLPSRVRAPEDDSGWSRNEVDRFILRKLRAAGLAPNDEADRAAWLRRVTFDLTGLPPTIPEVESFLADHEEGACERVVDRLLSTDAYAERMTSEWLDVARYSDSYGYQRDDERYVWPYRDWVINAFKTNQPYDEFVTWQLAGDLLPGATREQQLATTFCRLHSHKKEGGVVVEEFRVENVADRTHTFASAFLGLTMECARCHDHKYDPIPTKDYYQLSSFFANVDERGLISYFTDATPTPAMPLPSSEQERVLAEAERDIESAERALAVSIEAAKPRFEAWLQRVIPPDLETRGLVTQLSFDARLPEPPEEAFSQKDTHLVKIEEEKLDPSRVIAFENTAEGGKPAITNTKNQIVAGHSGDGVLLTGDDSIVIPDVGHIERHEPLTVSLWVRAAEVEKRGVIYRRSRGWDDAGSVGYALVQRGKRLRANVVHFWPGNAIAVETDDILRPDEWRHVTVTYDGSRQANGLRIYVDGEESHTRVIQDSLTRSISGWRGGYDDLAIGSRYRDRGFKGGVVDAFCVYDRALTPLEVRHAFDDESLTAALTKAARDRTDEETADLFTYYVGVIDEETRSARDRLQVARRRWDLAMDSTPAITVMREQPSPRPAYVLERGGYDSHGERVIATTPTALPPYPTDLPRNRLGLARWLFEPDHPLTARVAVNRYWQMLFGRGLVATPEDFGSQGAPPSHPELLDWLARDFVDHGWDVRRLVRMLVLTSTYRQSSVVDPAVRERDPENLLLSRSPGKRLSAEMVRDQALAVSGLLVRRVGGPPVKTYDLALAYTPVDADTGDALYRRSLYTFWKRTSPSPVMMTMNANRREVCQLRREVVSSPLQALVLLNGSQFVEASRVYSEQLLIKHGGDSQGLLTEAFLAFTGRAPQADEVAVLQTALEEQFDEFEAHPDQAEALAVTGAAPRRDGLDTAEVAAVTVVVNAIMNTDESIRCR